MLENDIWKINQKSGAIQDYIQDDILKPLTPIWSSKGSRDKRQIRLDSNKKWPNNTLFYYFDSQFSKSRQELFELVMRDIEAQTCVKFVENSTATNRVKIQVNPTQGCASNVGKQGGEQPIYFDFFCDMYGIAVHEMMHALGIFHSHERYDRLKYLSLKLDKISNNANYESQTNLTTYNSVPFEYGSTMLYKVNRAIGMLPTAKYSDYFMTMGNRRTSFYDIKMINDHYKCGCDFELKCENGGYPNPSNCSQCVCPKGWGGKLCDRIPDGRSSAIFVTSTDWTSYFAYLETGNEKLKNTFKTGILHIVSPLNTTIEFQLTNMTGFDCFPSCNANSIEIKYKGDPRIVNPLICCKDEFDDLWTRIYSPKTNVLPVLLDSRKGRIEIEFRARYIDRIPNNGKKITNGYDNYEYFED